MLPAEGFGAGESNNRTWDYNFKLISDMIFRLLYPFLNRNVATENRSAIKGQAGGRGPVVVACCCSCSLGQCSDCSLLSSMLAWRQA